MVHAAVLAAPCGRADMGPVGGLVASPADLDLQHLAVFGAGEHAQLQTTLRALRGTDLDRRHALGQVRQYRAAVSCRTGPLPSAGGLQFGAALPFASALAALALAAEHALLQIANLRLSQRQFGDRRRFALGRRRLQPIEKTPVVPFMLSMASNAAIKLGMPVARIHDSLDVLLFGQRHRHCRKWHRLRICWHRTGSRLALRRTQAPHGTERNSLCSAILALPLRRVHRMFTGLPVGALLFPGLDIYKFPCGCSLPRQSHFRQACLQKTQAMAGIGTLRRVNRQCSRPPAAQPGSPGRRASNSLATASYPAATRSNAASACGRPISCSPAGQRPLAWKPAGRLRPGRPAKVA